MDVKPISVVAIKPSVDSGGRERSPRQFGDAEQKDDKQDAQADNFAGDFNGEQGADDDAFDAPLVDAPELAPELPAPPKPGRYVNKVV